MITEQERRDIILHINDEDVVKTLRNLEIQLENARKQKLLLEKSSNEWRISLEYHFFAFLFADVKRNSYI